MTSDVIFARAIKEVAEVLQATLIELHAPTPHVQRLGVIIREFERLKPGVVIRDYREDDVP